MIRLNKNFAVLAVTAVLMAGCGMWTNFTTYFNRYYNAKEKFLEAEKIINEEKEELFEFRRKKSTTKARGSIESVVEGCSKILQYNKESSYVNDALFLLGKAFYFEQNFLKADRKFAELYALGKTELFLDSKLWLSKTKLQLRNFDLGLKLINEVIDSTIISENDELLTDALIAKTAFYRFRESYQDAINTADTLIKYSGNDQLNAEVAYEIGKMYLELKNNSKAREYFALVDEFSPTFEIEAFSRLEVARIGTELGKAKESFESLEDMKNDSRFEKFKDKIDLELGVVNYKLGKLEEAMDILTEVDTTYKKSESGAMASYYKAKIYEESYGNLDSALVYYKGAMYSQAPDEFKDIARDKEKLLRKYIDTKKEIDGYVTKYWYLGDSTRYIKDSLEYAKIWRSDSLDLVEEIETREFRTEEAKDRAIKAIKGILDTKYKDIKPEKNTFSEGELNQKLAKAQYEMAIYFYNDAMNNDSAKIYFDEVLQHYPDSIKTPQLIYSMGSFYNSYGNKNVGDSLLNYVYDNYNTELIANEAAKILGKPLYDFDSDPAKDIFKTAEKKYDSGDFEGALSIYKDIYKNYEESSYAPKSMLAASYIYEENLKDLDSVAVLYDSLSVKFSGTDYVKNIIGKQRVLKQFIQAREDSLRKLMPDSIKISKDSLNINSADSSKITPIENSIKSGSVDSLKTKSDSVKKPINITPKDSLKLKPDSAKIKKEVPNSDKPKNKIPLEKKDLKVKKDPKKPPKKEILK